ncbi:MAG TPA: helix-turn-helix transcriptional regulator [Burkholderiales bacterium]|nr:helix-turn-helix transcriptional regulator [Burkholderiales bacterium]
MTQAITLSAQLARILTARRRALKLSQKTVAAKLGISQNRLSEIEANPGRLSLQRLLDIANILDLELVLQDRKPVPEGDW